MMKSKSIVAFVIAILVLLFSGCSKINDIKITSCSIDSINLKGLRTAEATLLISVENPAMQFTLSDVEGSIYLGDEEIATYSAEPITINGKTVAVYPLVCSGTITKSMSLQSVVRLLSKISNRDLDNVYTSIQANIRLRSGINKTFRSKKIPVNTLLNK